MFQLIYSHGISSRIIKAGDETKDNIITVMFRNDQTLQKVTRERKGSTLTFIFEDQNNEIILSLNARNLQKKDE